MATPRVSIPAFVRGTRDADHRLRQLENYQIQVIPQVFNQVLGLLVPVVPDTGEDQVPYDPSGLQSGDTLTYDASLGAFVPTDGSGVWLPLSGGTLTGPLDVEGDLTLPDVGDGINLKEGADARMGVATLVGGTVTVNTTEVTANSRIFYSVQAPGGTQGSLSVSARVAGTSFTLTSTSALETSTVAWLILEPA